MLLLVVESSANCDAFIYSRFLKLKLGVPYSVHCAELFQNNLNGISSYQIIVLNNNDKFVYSAEKTVIGGVSNV